MSDWSESRDSQEDESQLTSGERISPRGEEAFRGINEAQPVQPRVPSDIDQAEDAVKRLSQIEEIEDEHWRNLEEPERLQAMQQVEEIMAEVQERPPHRVVSEAQPPGYHGFFNGQLIHLSDRDLNSDDVALNVDNVVHEGRHAYQQFAINNPGFHGDPSQVQAWRENFDEYIDPSLDPEEYRKQAIEQDAWGYAAEIRSELYSGS